MAGHKDTEWNSVSSDEVSATIYLNKLKQFSRDTFSGHALDSDVILQRTFLFIREILHMDCAFFGELIAPGAGGIKGVIGNSLLAETLSGQRLDLLSRLTEEVIVFTADDEGEREMINTLLDGYPVMSGISVPIECEDGPRGVLAVCARDARELSAAKILFVKSMGSVIALFLQSREVMPNFDIKHARLVIEAKRVWEGTVDALNQLVVVLDEEATIIRVNMTIEHWQLGTVNSHIHNSGPQWLVGDLGQPAVVWAYRLGGGECSVEPSLSFFPAHDR
jgi:hypothetical protein